MDLSPLRKSSSKQSEIQIRGIDEEVQAISDLQPSWGRLLPQSALKFQLAHSSVFVLVAKFSTMLVYRLELGLSRTGQTIQLTQ